jgi:hypothetical protein
VGDADYDETYGPLEGRYEEQNIHISDSVMIRIQIYNFCAYVENKE